MSGTSFTQAGRFLALRTPLGPDALLLEQLTGREAVSEPFAFTLDLLAPLTGNVPFARVLGHPASVRIGEERHIHGVITRLARRGRSDAFQSFRATLVPAFGLLARRVRSRVFQQQSVPTILRAALVGFPVRFELTGEYPDRDYCVQYRESDFAFACRLMEEEGIWYRFDHDAEQCTMVLGDASSLADRLPGLVFDPTPGPHPGPDRVTAWETAQELRSSRVALWDYAFQQPATSPDAESAAPEAIVAGSATYPLRFAANESLALEGLGGYAKQFDDISPAGQAQTAVFQQVYTDNARVARLRAEEEACRGLDVGGTGHGPRLSPGRLVALSRHPDADGDYFVTEVTHSVHLNGDYRSGGTAIGLDYSNEFRAVPAGLVWRPPHTTPRPTARGVETAVVVGPAGQPVYCDKYGRVKVRFLWDRDGAKEGVNSSCWVRVAQAWAGKGWGTLNLPRVGQEVVVGFRHGDPDMHLILGSVYNGEQTPPFALPANAAQSGAKSSSMGTTDPADFSGLGFDDTPGSEHVHLHSQKYMTQSAEETIFVNASGHHHTNVGSWCTRIVGGIPGLDHTQTVGAPASDGSGSGEGANPYYSPGPFVWNPSVEGGIAADLDMVVGWQQTNIVGLGLQITFGQYNTTTINPLSALTLLPGMGSLSSDGSSPMSGKDRILAGLYGSLFTGAMEVTMGGSNAFKYGPKLEMQRGYTTEIEGGAVTKTSFACASIYAALSALVLLEPLIPGVGAGDDDDATKTIAVGIATVAALELVMAVWMSLDTAEALVGKLAEEKETGEKMVQAAETVVSQVTLDSDRKDALAAAETLMKFLADNAIQSGKNAAELVTWRDAVKENPKLNQGGKDVFNGTWYNVFSPNVRLVSTYKQPAAGASELAPYIGISAVGGKNSAGSQVDGYTFIYGDTLGMFGGPQAFITAATTGDPANGVVTVNTAGSSGGVNLLYGATLSAPASSVIALASSGVAATTTAKFVAQAAAPLLQEPYKPGQPPATSGYLELDGSSGSAILYGKSVTVGNFPNNGATNNTTVAVTVGNTNGQTTVTVSAGNATVALKNNEINLTVGNNTTASLTDSSISLQTSGNMTLQCGSLSVKAGSVSYSKG